MSRYLPSGVIDSGWSRSGLRQPKNRLGAGGPVGRNPVDIALGGGEDRSPTRLATIPASPSGAAPSVSFSLNEPSRPMTHRSRSASCTEVATRVPSGDSRSCGISPLLRLHELFAPVTIDPDETPAARLIPRTRACHCWRPHTSARRIAPLSAPGRPWRAGSLVKRMARLSNPAANSARPRAKTMASVQGVAESMRSARARSPARRPAATRRCCSSCSGSRRARM